MTVKNNLLPVLVGSSVGGGGGGGGSFDGDISSGPWTPALGTAPANFNFTVLGSGATILNGGYTFHTGTSGGIGGGANQPFDTTKRGQGFTINTLPVGDTNDSLAFGLSTFDTDGLDPGPPNGGGLIIQLVDYDSTLQKFDDIAIANPFIGEFNFITADPGFGVTVFNPTIVVGDKVFFAVTDDGTVEFYLNGALVWSAVLVNIPTDPKNFSIAAFSPFDWQVDLIQAPGDVPAGVTQYESLGGVDNYPASPEGKVYEVAGLGPSGLQDPTTGYLFVDGLFVFFDSTGAISDLPTMGQHLTESLGNSLYHPKYNTVESSALPTVNDDITGGYMVFDKWIHTGVTPAEAYVLVNNTPGAAIWSNTTFTADEVGSMAFADTADYYTKTQTYTQTEINGKVRTPLIWNTIATNSINVAVNNGYINTSVSAICSYGLPDYTSLKEGDRVTIVQTGDSTGSSPLLSLAANSGLQAINGKVGPFTVDTNDVVEFGPPPGKVPNVAFLEYSGNTTVGWLLNMTV